MKKFVLLLALLTSACSKSVESYEEADAAIPQLIAEYRTAIFDNDKTAADKLRKQISDLIRAWRDGTSDCTVRAFQRSAQHSIVFAIPMEYALYRKSKLTEVEQEKALSHYYSLRNDTYADVNKLNDAISFCRNNFDEKYTPADLAAIQAASKPLQDIDKAVRTTLPREMQQRVSDTYASEVASGLSMIKARETSNKEVSNCIAAATVDPRVTAQVTVTEITAACKTMLK
jgi:predicted RNase H-like nuclease